MKWTLSALVLVALATGCAGNKNKSRDQTTSRIPPMNVASTEVPAAAPPAQFTPPPPQPIVYDAPQQPVIQDAPAAEDTFASAEPVAPSRRWRRSPGGGGGGGGSGGSGTRYRVKRGESLWSIAEAKYGNGHKWKAIAAANPGMDPNRIQAGQTIVLP